MGESAKLEASSFNKLDRQKGWEWLGEKHMERHWVQFDHRPAVSAAMLQAFMAVPNHSGQWTWKVHANPDGCLKDADDKALVDLFDQYDFICSMLPADSYVLGYGYTSFEVSCTLSSDL